MTLILYLKKVLCQYACYFNPFFQNSRNEEGMQLIQIGSRRLQHALEFAFGDDKRLHKQVQRERIGWNHYYEILEAVYQDLLKNDPFALEMHQKAQNLIRQFSINTAA